MPTDTIANDEQTATQLTEGYGRITNELGKASSGQREPIDQILIALMAGGHCLLTGAPGLAKTLLVNSIAKLFDLNVVD